MNLNKIYDSMDPKYGPIIAYLFVSPLNEFKELLETIKMKSGIMRDFVGFEYEDNKKLTFYDFTTEPEKKSVLALLTS